MTAGGNQPSILVQLGLKAEQFFTDLGSALNNALTQVKNWSGNVQQSVNDALSADALAEFTQQFDHLNTVLAVNQKTFASLTEDLDNFAQNSQQAAGAGTKYVDVLQQMNEWSITFGTNLRQAGVLLIQNGEAEINQVNAALLSVGQQVLSVNELRTAIDGESAAVNALLEKYGLMIDETGNLVSVNKQASESLGEVETASNDAGGALDFLANRIKTVVASLLIVQTIYAAIQAIKDLTAESQKLADIQYQLGTNIAYANAAIGPQIGSLDDWKQKISDLGKEFQVFSQTDITQAVSKALELGGQLGYTKDQINDLITVAAQLAERTGKSLIDTLTELGNALGGGRLQGLHDLGLYIRNTDLQVEAMNEGFQGSVNNLSDTERAAIALNLVMAKTSELVQTTGDYASSLGGQMATADAQIANSKDNIATNLSELNLLFKNLYASFLEYVSQITTQFQPLLDIITKINNAIMVTNNTNAQIGGPPTLGEFGVPLSSAGQAAQQHGQIDVTNQLNELIRTQQFNQFFKEAPGLLDTNSEAYAKLTEAIKAYADALQNSYSVQAQQASAFGARGLQVPNSVQGTGPSGIYGDMSDAEIKAIQDTTDKVNKAFDAAEKQYDDAHNKYMLAVEKSYDDETKAKIDALKKEGDAEAKLREDLGFQEQDSLTKYNRDIADLYTKESQDEQDAAEQKDKKLKDEKQKYYDDLRLLDEQYYFDIFDAVANNDAIAIIKAEQKYKLDKDKLDTNYKDQQNATNQNYEDTIQQIQKDTERRKQLLDERYKQELEDEQTQYDRKLTDLQNNLKDTYDQITQNYDAQRDALKDKWVQEKQIIDDNTSQALTDLETNLGTELQDHKDQWKALVDGWNKYYEDLKKLQGQYQGVVGVPPVPGSNPPPAPPPQQCPPGTVWCAIYNACMPTEVCGGGITGVTRTNATYSTNDTQKILITSDGSVSNEILNGVVRELSNAIQTIVIQRGG